MARRHQSAAAETLEELESAADRLGEWLQENLWIVLATIAVLLGIAGAGAWIVSSRHSAQEEASAALAKVRGEYLSAMGAGPGALEVPELANPEAAARIRSEYEERFGEVAASHPGTVAGTLAALEAAKLETQGGDLEGARKRLEKALEDAPGDPALRGMVLQQLAQDLEDAGRWQDAARRHLEAANLPGYPLHGWALADAARTTLQAGDAKGALELYDRLEVEDPELRLPDEQRAEVRELRARLAAEAPTPPEAAKPATPEAGAAPPAPPAGSQPEPAPKP